MNPESLREVFRDCLSKKLSCSKDIRKKIFSNYCALNDFLDVNVILLKGEVPKNFRDVIRRLEIVLENFPDLDTKHELTQMLGISVDNWVYLTAKERGDFEMVRSFEYGYDYRSKLLHDFLSSYGRVA